VLTFYAMAGFGIACLRASPQLNGLCRVRFSRAPVQNRAGSAQCRYAGHFKSMP
jgi:hypothetical protein